MLELRLAVVITVACLVAEVAFAAEGRDRDPRERQNQNWRRDALENMRVAAAPHLIAESEMSLYRGAGFNTMSVFDVEGTNDSGTAWKFKSEEQVRTETAFARDHGLPLILGMAVEPYTPAITKNPHEFAAMGVVANGSIPPATDDAIRERIALWKQYGDDVLVGVFPWYDDVFWQTVDVDRQRHVYRLIKDIAPDWYVFGMIGEFGFNATDEDVARYYDPNAFDHLIVLMYPFNVGADLTGFPLDNIASSDPDGDLTRYVDRFVARMNERFFSHLNRRQLILLVVQSFYYTGEPAGHIPRAMDVEIMINRGNGRIRELAGQGGNHSAAFFSWGEKGSEPNGMTQRPEWRGAAHNVNDQLAQDSARGFRRGIVP